MIPSAFFSVCLTVADDTEESRAATRRYLDEFVEETGWTPGRTATFAGALQYTDWDAVDRWAHELAAKFIPAAAGGMSYR